MKRALLCGRAGKGKVDGVSARERTWTLGRVDGLDRPRAHTLFSVALASLSPTRPPHLAGSILDSPAVQPVPFLFASPRSSKDRCPDRRPAPPARGGTKTKHPQSTRPTAMADAREDTVVLPAQPSSDDFESDPEVCACIPRHGTGVAPSVDRAQNGRKQERPRRRSTRPSPRAGGVSRPAARRHATGWRHAAAPVSFSRLARPGSCRDRRQHSCAVLPRC